MKRPESFGSRSGHLVSEQVAAPQLPCGQALHISLVRSVVFIAEEERYALRNVGKKGEPTLSVESLRPKSRNGRSRLFSAA